MGVGAGTELMRQQLFSTDTSAHAITTRVVQRAESRVSLTRAAERPRTICLGLYFHVRSDSSQRAPRECIRTISDPTRTALTSMKTRM